ncbi:MAG: hypothetical protein F6J97_09580 [Leptolyngbya sp. SIO4C1]|nr:hypothetical protein [Leptolyngbya sp. SIO4C1]
MFNRTALLTLAVLTSSLTISSIAQAEVAEPDSETTVLSNHAGMEAADTSAASTQLAPARRLTPEEQWLRGERANRLYDTGERHRRLGDTSEALASYRSSLFMFEVLAAAATDPEVKASFEAAASFVRSRISDLQTMSQAE